MDENILRLLIIEDNDDDVFFVVHELTRGGFKLEWKNVQDEVSLRQAIASQSWDAVITDYKLPQFNGPQALRLLRENGLDIPIIVVSGTIGEATAVEMMRAGANDYLMKGHLARLVEAMRRELREAAGRAEKRAAEQAQRESETAYRALFEESPVQIMVTRPDGIILDVNSTFCLATGLTRGEILGKTPVMLGLMNEEDARDLRDLLKKNGGILKQHETILHSAREAINYVQISIKSLELKGQPVIIAMIDNITPRKLAEKKIMLQLQQLHGLREVDSSISTGKNLETSLQIVLRLACELLEVDSACLSLLHASGSHFEQTYSQGDFCSSGDASELPITLAWQAVNQRKTITLKAGASAAPPAMQKAGLLISCAAPVMLNDEIKGVLEVFSKQHLNAPETEWVSFLETLAGQAAIAVANATLLTSLRSKNQELSESYESTIAGWARALEIRDEETHGHSERVLSLAVQVAQALNMPEAELAHFRRGVLLHDIGKIGIPDSILLKPGPLDPEEWKIMRRHPEFAYRLLKDIPFLLPALDVPYGHHERWDGSGYPRGLKGEEIPLSARIFAVVDVWDALTNDRPYRKAWSEAQAAQYMKDNANVQFDPRIVDVFLKLVSSTQS
ncbi:MAG TPA: HD domain-containing phosphohydrolase [Anaerolineaceae bacterium]|nr:HD domain-containing phosphohydrolase [Anaerolineaceae bacterium]HPN51350.1 HD domain-containing phosphohydrolase [Anaerolineaceae bacterium]